MKNPRQPADTTTEGVPTPPAGGVWLARRTLLHAGLFGAGLVLLAPRPVPAAQAVIDDIRYFRIGTAATTGTYFQIGGAIANAISKPPGSRDCDRGGSCGVPGLVAVAQATQGSVENVEAVATGKLESALTQSDVAYWAFTASGLFKGKPSMGTLRAIASLFPESVHIVVRADAAIRTIKELKGKRVGLGEKESGTLVDAKLVLEAAGLTERDVKAGYQRLSQAAEGLNRGELDAFFLFGGYPVPAITELAATTPIRLVPITPEIADRLLKRDRFFTRDIIPGGTYPGLETPTQTISTSAIWIVGAQVPEKLVYDVTQALWRDANRHLLEAGHPMGRHILLATAINGLVLPLHPGAARFYRETGLKMPVETQ